MCDCAHVRVMLSFFNCGQESKGRVRVFCLVYCAVHNVVSFCCCCFFAIISLGKRKLIVIFLINCL